MAVILLVDDDESFRKMLSMSLEAMGHKVIAVVDGAKAWAAYGAEPFDLVIMDLIMPNKEGLETIQQFRRNRSTVKILAITGGGRGNAGDLLSVARVFGAEATLQKPFSNEQLVATLKQLLPAAH
jgi:DNA-binding response OmpR family regulator